MPDVFINYRTGDGEEVASLIQEGLSNRFGSEKIFRDNKSIRLGENYRKALIRGVVSCRVLVAIIGPTWLVARDQDGRNALDNEEDWIRREIIAAFDHGLEVIPLLAGDSVPRLSRSVLPPALSALADRQALRIDPANYREGLEKLASELADLVPGLAERSAKVEQEPSGANTHNNVGHDAQSSVQTEKYTDNQSGGTRTVIHNASGPVFSGKGTQYNGPVFGDGTNLITGKNTGGIHQNFGSRTRPGEER